MNCYEFEAVVLDVVSGCLMEVRLKQAALAHAETCPQCGLRLEQEQQLTTGLRAVAAKTERAKAPAKLNPELQAAFRNRFPSQIQKPQHRQLLNRSEWFVLAASLVILLTGTGLVWVLVQLAPVDQMVVNEIPKVSSPSNSNNFPTEVRPVESSHEPSMVEPKATPNPEQKQRRTSLTSRSKPTRTQSRADTLDDLSNEFIPLTYVADSTAMESGQIVQMYIPRSTLISMGLSTNVENSGDYVKAQVVMSDDGVPRSIRILPE
ncbi:MAG: hypothetical protein HY774_24905 [Acidobacteria bacterium]|nr:hypothetical protein [Acidobacteriota bacterium]